MKLDDIRVTTDQSELDVDLIFDFLHYEASWSKGIPRQVVEKAIQNSLCFAAFIGERQVGFARMVTDFASFGNLVDVFVLSDLRGNGIARQLLQAVNDHPDLQGLRRITLATSDKHELYRKFGFEPLVKPETYMEKYKPNVYSV